MKACASPRRTDRTTQTTQYQIDSARLTEPASTPWVTYPGLYSATCGQRGGAA
jgi:hypothetical protein